MSETKRRWVQRPPGSNWGDFGDDDQLGRLNLITPECRRAAAAEVREGRTFCLALPMRASFDRPQRPQQPAAGRPVPLV